MDGANGKSFNRSKAVKVNAVIKKKTKTKDFELKRVVIDDDSEDEAIISMNREDNAKLNFNKNEDSTNSTNLCMHEQQSADISKSSNDHCTVEHKSELCNNFAGESFKYGESVESCDMMIDTTSLNTPRELDVKNIESDNLDDGGFIKEFEQVFNERVKVNFACADEHTNENCQVDVKADTSIPEHIHNLTNKDEDEDKGIKCSPPAGNDICGETVGRSTNDICGETVGRSTNDICGEKVGRSANENTAYVEDVMILSEYREEIKRKKSNHITSTYQGKVLHGLENDVIAKTFKTGDRQHAWESLKTKKHVVPRKKVIYPVVVKDSVTRSKESCEDDKVVVSSVNEAPILSPLMEFQNALEKQIKDLVTSLQSLHTIEKDAILNTISQKQESANKQTLESMIDLLIAKKTKLEEEGVSVQPQSSRLGDTKNVNTSNQKTVDPISNTSKQPCSKNTSDVCVPIKTYSTRNKMLSPNPAVNSGSSIVTSNNSNKKISHRNKNINTKKKSAPPVSILKTPVRRKKPPLPFSETVQNVDGAKMKNDNAQLPMSDCGYALLHEILKDCSSTNVSLEKHQLSPQIASSEIINNKIDSMVAITEVIEYSLDTISHSTVRSKDNSPVSNDNKENSVSASELNAPCPVKNTTKVVNETCYPHVKAKCDEQSISSNTSASNIIGKGVSNVSQATHTNPISKLNLKYDTLPNRSLDERLQKLREHFVNSENQWLYESPEDQRRGTDDCLRNAEKVLKESQVTRHLLEKNENFKYTDMLKYFDANPYLVEPDVVRIKKNIDDNITKMTMDIQKKVHKSDKHKPMPLREKNVHRK